MVPEKSGGLDDLVLLRQAAGGDNPGALNEILIKYREGLRRMIAIRMSQELQGRLDASDVVQDTFIEATRSLDAYLKNPIMPVKLWLRHLAGQKLTQAHRVHLAAQKRAVEREQPLDGGGPGVNSESLVCELIANSATPSQIAVRNETKDRLMQALNAMTEADREVLTLRHFEHMTSQETADILCVSNDAVKKRYVRALEKLQRILQQDT